MAFLKNTLWGYAALRNLHPAEISKVHISERYATSIVFYSCIFFICLVVM
jgi:hypothetical protein